MRQTRGDAGYSSYTILDMRYEKERYRRVEYGDLHEGGNGEEVLTQGLYDPPVRVLADVVLIVESFRVGCVLLVEE